MEEHFSYEELARATDGFSPASLVGKGSHGSVFLAELPNRRKVAVKTPNHGDLLNEIRILSSLPAAKSRHVITFLGTSRHDSSEFLVTEYLPNGSLRGLLRGSGSGSGAPEMTWRARVRIAGEVAEALRYLHEEAGVVHRDVKPENVLFDFDFTAKLADFGLAVKISSENDTHNLHHVHPSPAGTIGYMDPNYTSPENLSPKNDTFSFGVLLLELLTAKTAVEAMPLISDRRLTELCDARLPSLEGDSLAAVGRILALAAACVSEDERRRPAMADVAAALGFGVAAERDRFFLFRRWEWWWRIFARDDDDDGGGLSDVVMILRNDDISRTRFSKLILRYV